MLHLPEPDHTAMKHRDFAQALVTVLVRHLKVRREAILGQKEEAGGRWNPILSHGLDQVDEALTRLGYFDRL